MFEDIIGHTTVKNGLMHATQTGRLHHALLFTGPEGIGKGMLARAFVQAWLCEQTTAQKLCRCQKCPNCKRIAENNHPDFIEVDEETATIKIETIRDLQHRLIYPPYEAPHRFVMIHDIHKMQDAAANCLLKTLEEPDPDTTFLLITSQIQKLLPTIISRCQIVRFAPFGSEEVAQFLQSRGVAPEVAIQLAALSNGSFSTALELSEGDYKTEVIHTFEEMITIGSTLDAFGMAAALKGKKNMADHLLSLMAIYIRDMLLLKSSPDAPIMLKHYKDRMVARLSKTSAQDLHRAGSLIQEIHGAFLGNLNEQVVWERLMVGMHGVFF